MVASPRYLNGHVLSVTLTSLHVNNAPAVLKTFFLILIHWAYSLDAKSVTLLLFRT